MGDEKGPRMTDSEFFSALNLEYSGLQSVKKAVKRSDLEAKKEFAAHIRSRQKPRWFFDWKKRSNVENPDTRYADQVLAHKFAIGGWHDIVYDFGEEIDWQANPLPYSAGEKRTTEWNESLNRHYQFFALGRAYRETGGDRYAEEFVKQILGWIERNLVPLDHSGNSLMDKERYVIYAWQTLNTSVRAGETWFETFYRCLSSKALTDEAIVTIVKSLCEHARHLIRWPTGGNWLTMESTALFYVGVVLPEFKEAATWRKTAIERLYMQLNKQVYPDGLEYELAIGYNQWCLTNFTRVVDMASLNDRMAELPEDYLDKIEKMYNYNLYASMPNGRVPGLNDSGDADVREALPKGYGYFPRRTDFLYVCTGGREGDQPKFDSYALPYTGHYVMRSGWDPNSRYLLFDAGPFGAGHQHEDKLTIVLYAYGRPQILDPGNYMYDASKQRRYIISTWGHNTILVDGLGQNRRARRETYTLPLPFKPLGNLWVSEKDYDYAVGTYKDGYGLNNDRSVTHTRKILFVKPDYWIITDILAPIDERVHRYESLFHLNAERAKMDPETKAVVTLEGHTSNIAIIPLADEEMSVDIVSGQEEPVLQGWTPATPSYLTWYGLRAIPTSIFSKEGGGIKRFLYVLYPIPRGKKSPVASAEPLEAFRENGEEAHAIAAKITFTNGVTHYFMQADKPGERLIFSNISCDGEIALVEVLANGETGRRALVRGTYLTQDGEQLVAS